jgi:hypothetical protein
MKGRRRVRSTGIRLAPHRFDHASEDPAAIVFRSLAACDDAVGDRGGACARATAAASASASASAPTTVPQVAPRPQSEAKSTRRRPEEKRDSAAEPSELSRHRA